MWVAHRASLSGRRPLPPGTPANRIPLPRLDFDIVHLPLWVAIPLFVLAAVALLDRLLKPGARWLVRQRVNRALDEANRRLQIRLQPFKLTKRQVLIDRLIYDPEVVAVAEEHARLNEQPQAVAMQAVERYAREIVPAFNAYVYFRLGFWLSRLLARTLYRVRLGAVDEEALRRVPPDSTVVFVMNHRSNFDYLLVSYLVAEQTALSYAVGEWARVWPLDTLVRSMGAYFVRRRSRNDLYRRVLARYVAMATSEGVTQALYPEGRLSRDGRLGPPKLGLFDYMLRSWDPAGERDLVFVPVGINYDRVLEDRTLLRDLDPAARRVGAARAVWTFLRFALKNFRLASIGRWYRFGYACVKFGRPLSMKEFSGEHGVDLSSLGREARFARVAELAEELMDRVHAVVPALPAALVSTVLLREPERPRSALELKAAAQALIAELESRGVTVYVPRADRDYAIQVGLRMLTLRRAVEERQGLFHAVPAELPLLAYYANSIAPRSSEARPNEVTSR